MKAETGLEVLPSPRGDESAIRQPTADLRQRTVASSASPIAINALPLPMRTTSWRSVPLSAANHSPQLVIDRVHIQNCS